MTQAVEDMVSVAAVSREVAGVVWWLADQILRGHFIDPEEDEQVNVDVMERATEVNNDSVDFTVDVSHKRVTIIELHLQVCDPSDTEVWEAIVDGAMNVRIEDY